jgi:hypothetical protein
VSAATAKPVPATTATAARARLARTRFVHRQSPPAQFGAVQCRHRFVRIGIHRHFDKRKTARLTCISVLHNLYSIHLAVCGKCRIQILLGSLERNVPDINVLQGVLLRRLPFRQVDFIEAILGRVIDVKAGKVAVGGFEQPLPNSTSVGEKIAWAIVRLRTFVPTRR